MIPCYWKGCLMESLMLDKDMGWYGVGTVGHEAGSLHRDTWVAADWGQEVTAGIHTWHPWDGTDRAAGLRPCKLVPWVS